MAALPPLLKLRFRERGSRMSTGKAASSPCHRGQEEVVSKETNHRRNQQLTSSETKIKKKDRN